jgi:uncharacterized protein YndB with AHSA1/START domain
MTTVVTRKPLELLLKRTFDAPRRLVFEAWSRPEHLARWWGPKGFTLPTCEVDFRTGGRFRLCMRAPNGTEYPFAGVYDEVVPSERIVFTGAIHDGNDVTTTVTFAEAGGKTTLTVRQAYAFESDATRGAAEGWTQSLERLADLLVRS